MTINESFEARDLIIRNSSLGDRREKSALLALRRVYNHFVNTQVYLASKRMIVEFHPHIFAEEPVFTVGLVEPEPISLAGLPTMKPRPQAPYNPEPPDPKDSE
jgi:hypothetical protein